MPFNIQGVFSKINYHFSGIANNVPKKCFGQKLVIFRPVTHLDIRNFLKIYFFNKFFFNKNSRSP